MRRPWVWSFLLGTLLGIGAGFILARWFLLEGPATGSAFLTSFSLQAVAARAGDATWQVPNDSRGHPGQASFTRQITARTTMPPAAQQPFLDRFKDEVKATLKSQGGTERGDWPANFNERGASNSTASWRRVYYTIDNTDGAVDISLIGNEEHVTLTVTFTEISGPGLTRFRDR